MSKSVVFLGVFARSKGDMSKSVMLFLGFLGKVEKCSVFVCFVFLCVFARSKGGNVEKCRVCRKKSCFCVCFLGKVRRWGPRAQCTTYYIIYTHICIYVYREREGDCICISLHMIHIYIYVYIYIYIYIYII